MSHAMPTAVAGCPEQNFASIPQLSILPDSSSKTELFQFITNFNDPAVATASEKYSHEANAEPQPVL